MSVKAFFIGKGTRKRKGIPDSMVSKGTLAITLLILAILHIIEFLISAEI